ncbi:MAG: RluA family pseudouridine synthase [Eubacterium sp.]
MRILEFVVENRDNGRRIKDFLRDFGVSSSLLVKLKHSRDGIAVNGSFARTIDTVYSGDVLRITIDSSGHMPSPTEMDIDVLYEDEDILVLDKPPFIPVHESRNHIGDTLSNFVAYHVEQDTAFRAVFRLDRDTSGAVLVAKHELAASKLAGKIDKDYYALVSGVVDEPGVVDAPVSRCGDSIIKRRVSTDGEYAVTRYYPLAQYGEYSLVRFKLLTGRTHQIRVHMSYIGHPLLGDSLYDGSTDLINRQALHCGDIYFTHPITGEDIHITSPFPSDMKNLMKG